MPKDDPSLDLVVWLLAGAGVALLFVWLAYRTFVATDGRIRLLGRGPTYRRDDEPLDATDP